LCKGWQTKKQGAPNSKKLILSAGYKRELLRTFWKIMSWAQVQQLIEYQLENFSNNAPMMIELLKQADYPTFTKPLESKEFFIAEEKKLRESVDRACQQFAKQRNWPKMSASETLLMLERLKEARDLLQFLHLVQEENLNDLARISEAELMELLLVHYWHHIGRDRYLSRHSQW
jgi:hypothetical protein